MGLAFYAADFEQVALEASKVTSLLFLSILTMLLEWKEITLLMRQWTWIGSELTLISVLFGMYRDNRLESTLQYANSLAIFLMACLLISLVFYINEKKRICLLIVTINALGLLLTSSRSVGVLWLIALIAVVIIYPQVRSKTNLISIGCAHIVSLLAAFAINRSNLRSAKA